MAIGTPTSLGSLSASAGSTSHSFTMTGAAPSNSRLFIAAGFWAPNATEVVTPSGGGLTWTQLAQGQAAAFSGIYTIGLYTADCAAGLSATALTLGLSAASGGMIMAGFYDTGLATGTSPGDGTGQTTLNTAGNTTWTSGALATTTNANDLLVGIGFGDGDPGTATATGTLSNELFDIQEPTNQWSMEVTYAVVAATGAYTATGTWASNASAASNGLIAAIKDGAGAGGSTIVSPLQLVGPSYAAQRAASV